MHRATIKGDTMWLLKAGTGNECMVIITQLYDISTLEGIYFKQGLISLKKQRVRGKWPIFLRA